MQHIEEQLWNYIDGTATPKELAFIQEMIAGNETWKSKYKELLEVNQLLKTELELEQPSMRFSKNVMDTIAGMQPAKATTSYINKNIIRSIAAFFILTIAGLLVYGFSQLNFSTGGGTSMLPFDLNGQAIKELNFSKYMSSGWINIILMVNAVLALMFLDNYFNRKKKTVRQ